MPVIVITGSIATGKSTVSRYLMEKGYPVIDSDLIARQVVERGQEGLVRLVEVFGQEILLDSGQLNRARLGEIIFQNEGQKNQVNEMLHPLIFEEIEKQIRECQQVDQEAIVFVDIPLYFEVHVPLKLDQVWLVYTDRQTQISRLMARNQISQTEAMTLINNQISIEEKRSMSDFIIDNSGDLLTTYQQVDSALNKLNQ